MIGGRIGTKLGDWIAETAAMLQGAGTASPLRDARLLAAAGCGLSNVQVLSEPERMLDSGQLERLDGLRRRRGQREPVSRILGRRSFMSLELEISSATLDPRPDTEVLVEAAIGLLAREGRTVGTLSVCDLGTGSGAILIALLQALPQARGLGIDVSSEALEVARRNAVQAGVDDRAGWRLGHWLDGVDACFDVIASNPPYVPSNEIARLDPEVAKYDPWTALDGGPDGMTAYREIVATAGRCLNAGGWLVLEAGDGQADAVAGLVAGAGIGSRSDQHIFPDMAGRLRCVAQKAQWLPRMQKK